MIKPAQAGFFMSGIRNAIACAAVHPRMAWIYWNSHACVDALQTKTPPSGGVSAFH